MMITPEVCGVGSRAPGLCEKCIVGSCGYPDCAFQACVDSGQCIVGPFECPDCAWWGSVRKPQMIHKNLTFQIARYLPPEMRMRTHSVIEHASRYRYCCGICKILRYHGAPNCPVMEHVTEHTAFLRQSFFLKFRIEYWKYVLAAAAQTGCPPDFGKLDGRTNP